MENLTVLQLSEADIRAIIREELISILGNQQLNITKQQTQNEILSFEETCKFLKTPVSTLYYYTSKNLIPHVKKGKKLFFVKEDLVEWIKAGKKNTQSQVKANEDYFLLKVGKKGKSIS